MGKHPENGTIYGLLRHLGNSEQTRWLKIQSQNGNLKRRVIFLFYIYIYIFNCLNIEKLSDFTLNSGFDSS